MAAFTFSITDSPPGKDLLDLLQDSLDEGATSGLQKLLDSEKYGKFLEKGVAGNAEDIFDLDDEDIDAVFNLAFVALVGSVEGKEMDTAALKLAAALASDPAQKFSLKIDLLSGLFYVLPPSASSRPSIMFTLLQMYLDAGKAADLRLSEIETLSKDLTLQSGEEAELYRLLGEVAEAAGLRASATQAYRCKYLAALEGGSKALGNSAEVAAQAVLYTLTTSGQGFQALTPLPAVQNLKKANSEVFQLLTIFDSGSVSAFNTFVSKNKKFLKKSKLSESVLRTNMQSLTICGLAQNSNVLSYDDVQEALSLKSDEEVEEALVNATQAGVVEIKIDQEQRCVEIEFAAPRFAFGSQSQDWERLASTLSYWRESVHSVLNQLNSMDPTLEEAVLPEDLEEAL